MGCRGEGQANDSVTTVRRPYDEAITTSLVAVTAHVAVLP
jgi:hypothetical protein